MKTPFAVVSLWFLSLLSAYSGLLAYDSFSYTNDHNYYKSGGFGWSDAWGGLAVTNGLTYTKTDRPLGTQGAGAMLGTLTVRSLDTSPLGPFSAMVETNGLVGKEGSEIWVSFLLRPIELNQFFAGVWFGSGFSLYLTNGMTQLAPGVPLAQSTTYFVVEHIRFGANNEDTREEYFNPVPSRDNPGSAQGTNVFLGNMSFNSVALIGNSSRPSAGTVDELRFGEYYADVSPLSPITLTNIQCTACQMTFTFQSLTGLLHTLETRVAAATGSWNDVTNFLGDGNVIQVMVPTTNETQFFRVRTE